VSSSKVPLYSFAATVTIACDNPVFVKAIERMWPTPEEKQEFIFELLAKQPWPGAAQA
jgi:hypothetical protein